MQLDVNKPLVTAILIGKFEQSICYEGIQKLCFGCGRVGHRKESCLYIIRQKSSSERTEARTEGSVPSFPCKMHVPDKVQKGQDSNESVSGSVKEEATDGTYGPWVVVTRRRNGTKNFMNGGASMDQVQEQPRRGHERNRSWVMSNMGNAHPSHNNGPEKDVKRKLSPNRKLNGPLLASSL